MAERAMENVFVTKGMRVLIRAIVAQKMGTYSLAGVQMKLAAREVELTGRIAHVRGDHPTAPTSIGVWIEPDDATAETIAHFEKLEIEAAVCKKCNRLEIGPFAQSAIKALL